MYVEDAIKDFHRRVDTAGDVLGGLLQGDDWTTKFIRSLGESVQSGRALSSRQGEIFVKTVVRYRDRMIETGCGYSSMDLDKLILSPMYRTPPYQSVKIMREVRYLGDDKLGFRFPRDDKTMEMFKRMRQSAKDYNWRDTLEPKFNYALRLWIVPVNAANFKTIMTLIGNHAFQFDDEVAGYLALCEASANQPSTVVVTGDQLLINVCDSEVISLWAERVLRGRIA